MNNNDIKTVTLTINSEQAQRKLDDINRQLEQARLKRQKAVDYKVHSLIINGFITCMRAAIAVR